VLKVGFIGLGTISHEHILGYLGCEDAQVVAVCSLEEAAARDWLEKWKLPHARYYRSHDEMLAKEALDIVEVLTPVYLHASHALACSRAGVKGISVQKPMAMTLGECDEVIAACKRTGTKLKVYENYLFYPVYVRAKQLIDQEIIGEPMSVRVNTLAGIRDGAEWPWCWKRDSWPMDLRKAGFAPLVGSDGYHKFSLARWFLDREIEKISAWIDPATSLDAPAMIRAKCRSRPGEDAKYIQLDFSFSTRLSIPCDFWLDDFVEIVGSKGVMWINQCAGAGNREFFSGNTMSNSPVFPPIAVFVDGKVTTFLAEMTAEERNWSSSFVASTRHFVEVMKDGGSPIYTGEMGKEINRYITAAHISAQEGRDVHLDEVTTEAEAAKRFEIKTNFCNL